MDVKLLDVIVCPKCKHKLLYDEKQNTLECQKCQLIYPIRDGIPVLILEEATEIKS